MTARSDDSGSVEQNASALPEGGVESVGRYLSRQRRLRGISLQELSELTKIPLRSLERLESGQFDGSADGFVRGFVRTVAEGLGLDVDDTVARMMTEVQVDERRAGGPSRMARRWIALAVVVTTLVLLVTGVRAVWRAVGSATDARSDARVYWRDPVRALADATGSIPAEIPTRLPGEPSQEEGTPRAVARGPDGAAR